MAQIIIKHSTLRAAKYVTGGVMAMLMLVKVSSLPVPWFLAVFFLFVGGHIGMIALWTVQSIGKIVREQKQERE